MALLTRVSKRNRRRASSQFAVLLACMASILPLAASAQPADNLPVREHQIKAAGVYHIVAFVDWPASAFETETSPLVIAVLGHGPVSAILHSFVENETRHGRKVIVQHHIRFSEVRHCHVLYIARSEHQNWPSIRQELGNRPILTISDAENFAARGGSVQFAVERNRLRPIINVAATRRAGLTVSSKLLRLRSAEVIGEDGP